MIARFISAGLIPLPLTPFAVGSLNPILDATLCALLLIHSYVGFQYIFILPSKQRNQANVLKVLDYRLLPKQTSPGDQEYPHVDTTGYDNISGSFIV